MVFDKEKFKALVLYVIWRTGNKPGFGATKLNKVLWFADARAYLQLGKPITGATYTRGEFGPIPRQIMPVRKELESEGCIKVTTEPYYSREITRFHLTGPPSRFPFSDEERKIIDYWLQHIDEDHTAESVSDMSHDYPWEIAEMGEVIPLHAVFATRIRAPEGAELEWAKAEAKRLGLL